MLPLLTWLIQGAVGPALAGLPVTWAATDLAGAARGWVRRLRRSDGLSRIVQAAAAGNVELSHAEFGAVRQLLEKESTWVEVGRGTVEDLAALIASCLRGRAGEGSLAAGRAIAGGLLEFAIRDLEPDWFRQVLFARLERMQADQTSALDQAMLGVHADLAALFACQDAADEDRFAGLTGQLALALDRLPPGPADQGEVAVYLATLIRWLNTDPWPQDTRFDGQALTPATIERKLQVASGNGGGVEELDADYLGRRCVRLVVLGGPGSGKTWLARRTARLCAEEALRGLAGGAGLDEVDLPLFTTCARLAAAPPGDGVRRAVVSSALGQLPDLGGSRVADALRVLFEARNAPTLLVADSLDEALGADDRICQADTLPEAWRIVLTSRPASWNRQLAINCNDPVRRVGVLQPLGYPSDVEPFIERWFAGKPARAADLAAQLRNRPALQQPATVPLILAFYCIIGGEQPLPGRRSELYAKVIRRMLTGRWRGSGARDPDPDACLETLRDWAWSAAISNRVSGIGEWTDEFPTPRVRQPPDDRDALDNVAVPLGPPDPDTWTTQRRFVHRSIREYLVAEHVALRMSAEEATGELLNHLWYDPDWEYAAPTALALHPQRDQILKDLYRGMTGGDQLRADFGAIDGCWQIRRFLAQVALESGEESWSPEAAAFIGQARLDIGTPRQHDLPQIAASDWPTSNSLIMESLLRTLASEANTGVARALTETVAGLAVSAVSEDDRARAREALLALLVRQTDPWVARELAETVAGLDPSAADRAQAREVLLALLPSRHPLVAQGFPEAIAGLAQTEEDRAQVRETLLALLISQTGPGAALDLAETVAGLDPPAEDRAQARKALLALLPGQTDPWAARGLTQALAGLDPSAQDRGHAREALLALLPGQTDPWVARGLTQALAGLDPSAEDRAQAREALLGLLAGQTSSWLARELTQALAGLDPAAEDRAQAREALLGLLARQTDPGVARELAKAVAGLNPSSEDRAQAAEALLGLLPRLTASSLSARGLAEAVTDLDPLAEHRTRVTEALLDLLARQTDPGVARELAQAVAGLDPSSEHRAQAREALLDLLAGQTYHTVARELAEVVTDLDPSAEDRARVTEALLALLARQTSSWPARELAETVARLDPSPKDRAQARKTLLDLLAGQTNSADSRTLPTTIAGLAVTAEDRAEAREALLGLLAGQASSWLARELAEAVAGLDPSAGERAQVRETVLALLASETRPGLARGLAQALSALEPSAEDRAQARGALVRMLVREPRLKTARELAQAVAGLAVTGRDQARAREALVTMLASETHPRATRNLAQAIAGLEPSPKDRALAREALLAVLASETSPTVARELAKVVAGLDPTIVDLGGSDSWPFPPEPELLATARRNSRLTAWLAALPMLRINR